MSCAAAPQGCRAIGRLGRAHRLGHGLRRQPGGHGEQVFGRQATGLLGHAIGCNGVSGAGAPRTELGEEVVARQAQQPGHRRQGASELRAVAFGTGGQFAGRVATPRQGLAACQERWRCARHGGPVVREVKFK